MFSITIVAAVLLVLFAALYFYVKSCYTYWARRGLPTLSTSSFPFGHFRAAFLQQKTVAENVKDLYNKSDAPVLGAYMGLNPIIIPRDPRIIQHMLVKESASFSHRGLNVNEHDKMVHMLFLQNGERWREMRRMLSPAFTSGRLKEMYETIVNCTKSLHEHLDNYAESGKTLEIYEVMACFTTNVIASITFGLDIDCIKDPKSEFRKNGGRFFDSNLRNGFRNIVATMSPTLTRWTGIRFVDKEVQEFMHDIVRQNLEYREKNNVVCKDIFQLLIQVRNSGKMQDEGNWNLNSEQKQNSLDFYDIAAQSFNFYVAGYESSATTMTFCMYEMAKNPDIQQKAYEDIMNVLAEHNNQLDYNALAEMNYLGKCLMETLRLHPPFGVYTRRCVKDYQIPDTDIVIPDGTTVLFPISALQSDSQFYENPDQFIPERYDESETKGKTFVDMPFLAFGDGPRICIGQRLAKLQSKLAVCLMMQRFKFELGDEHKNKPLTFKPSTIIKSPTNGINLIVTRR